MKLCVLLCSVNIRCDCVSCCVQIISDVIVCLVCVQLISDVIVCLVCVQLITDVIVCLVCFQLIPDTVCLVDIGGIDGHCFVFF
jgi:hypothetical protein